MSRDGARRFRATVLRFLLGPVPVLFVVVLALAVVSVVVVTAGPARFGEPRIGVPASLEPPFPRAIPDRAGCRQQAQDQSDAGPPGWTTVLWIMAFGAALVLLVRWAIRLLRAAEARSADRVRDDDTPAGLAPLAAVRRAVRKAGDVLTRPVPAGHERDAVIRCWLALEEAGSQAGTARLPAQTPSEFTTGLLAQHHADQAATSQLLRLYHRARFGSRTLGQREVAEARSALARIDASLSRAAQIRDQARGVSA